MEFVSGVGNGMLHPPLAQHLSIDRRIYMVILIITITVEEPMITETNAVAFRQNLGEMINQVQFRRDTIVIKKDGKTVAALVDARLFERIRQMRERFDTLAGRLAHAYADVPEQDGLAEIDRITAKVRGEAPSKAARSKKG
jgi:prevent-host-death family protein